MRIMFQCLLLSGYVHGLVMAGEPLELGSRRELFVDRFLVESFTDTQLRLGHPVKEDVVLTFDAPWEGRYCGYVSLCTDGPAHRIYYRGLPLAGKDGSDTEVTCVAESADGLHWTKPELGLFEVNGSKSNNVVLAGLPPFSHNFAPFLDSRPGVAPDARYKALAGTSATGLAAFASEDGYSWRKLVDEAVIAEGAFDSQNVAFWSEAEQCYVAYFRTWSEGDYDGIRTVSRATSPDFVTWSAPQQMEFGDTPLEHLYTNQTTPYPRAPHLYVSLAARFMPGRRVVSEEMAKSLGVEGAYAGDCSDSVLMTSRGGAQYDRTFMEGFLKPGIGLENWTSRTNYPARGFIQTREDELSFYVQENYGQPTARLRRYSLRPDGFASLYTGYKGGEMRTHPLTFTGEGLYLNFATSAAGEVRVEILDANGSALPGFALDDAEPAIGNELERRVSWKGGASLAPIAGQTVRLRFVMKDAELFAIQFK
ncbi:MAG: hypothetical protein HYV27_22825 [Candidatus Hydrogenedentes bacterium]|nr:hypothetical protein [Candidatus Hydrogenedentota bacterium]